jgi:hypothetical protein
MKKIDLNYILEKARQEVNSWPKWKQEHAKIASTGYYS